VWDGSHHTDDPGCELSSELIRAASAGGAGAKITMPRSGRPSTAKLEYSSAISPAYFTAREP
jgi:hypothetical protein